MIPFYETRYEKFFHYQWVDLTSWPAHLHHQIEFVYLEKGKLEVSVENEIYTLTSGDLAIISPNTVHNLCCKEKVDDRFILHGFVCFTELMGDYEKLLADSIISCPIVRASAVTDEIKFLISKLAENSFGENTLLIKSYIQLFMALIWDKIHVNHDSKVTKHDITHKIVKYIMDNYTRPISAGEVATAVGVTNSYLARVFSAKLDSSFNEYVNKIRVQLACNLLKNSDYSIIEVMNECGFESQSTFNRAFRKYIGMNPREYRITVLKDRK